MSLKQQSPTSQRRRRRRINFVSVTPKELAQRADVSASFLASKKHREPHGRLPWRRPVDAVFFVRQNQEIVAGR